MPCRLVVLNSWYLLDQWDSTSHLLIPIPLNGRAPPLSNLVEGDPQWPPLYPVPCVHCSYKSDTDHPSTIAKLCLMKTCEVFHAASVKRPWHKRPEVWTTFSHCNDLATSLTAWSYIGQLAVKPGSHLCAKVCHQCLQMGLHTCDRFKIGNRGGHASYCHIQEPSELGRSPKLSDPESPSFHRLLRNTETSIHKHDLLKNAM